MFDIYRLKQSGSIAQYLLTSRHLQMTGRDVSLFLRISVFSMTKDSFFVIICIIKRCAHFEFQPCVIARWLSNQKSISMKIKKVNSIFLPKILLSQGNKLGLDNHGLSKLCFTSLPFPWITFAFGYPSFFWTLNLLIYHLYTDFLEKIRITFGRSPSYLSKGSENFQN